MGKNYYTPQEACEKLGMTADQLKELVRNGKVREYRDGGKVNYKASQIDGIASGAASSAGGTRSGSSLGGSVTDLDMLGTADLTLDDSAAGASKGGAAPPADDDIELRLAPQENDSLAKQRFSKKAPAPTGDAPKPAAEPPPAKPPAAKPPADKKPPASPAQKKLEDSDALLLDGGDSALADAMSTGDLILEPLDVNAGTKGPPAAGSDIVSLHDTAETPPDEDDKEGTVVSSIGVSVFDEDEVEQEADPLAKTVMSPAAGGEALGIDGVGSGSGLLDLTRESDDTSLGAELLDEIYPGGEEMGEATRAGMAEHIPESAATPVQPRESPVAEAAVAAGPAAVAAVRYEFAPDALATGLTGALFVGVLVMCLAGLTTAAAVQDAWPGILQVMYSNNWIVALACLVLAGAATGVGYYLGQREGK